MYDGRDNNTNSRTNSSTKHIGVQMKSIVTKQ